MKVNPYLAAAGLGVIAGMRSMSAPALVSDHFSRAPSARLAASPLRWLGAPGTAKILKLLALGEVGADKLPGIPARIEPGPLAARGVSGALAGGAVCVAAGESVAGGAVVGALAAVASSFAFYHLRRSLGEKSPVPDPVLASIEDALVLGIGRVVLASGGDGAG